VLLATRYSLLLFELLLFELLLPEPFDSVFPFDPEKPPGVPAPRCTVVCLELSLSWRSQSASAPSRHLPLQ